VGGEWGVQVHMPTRHNTEGPQNVLILTSIIRRKMTLKIMKI
jgi:hypothetical protein